MLLDNIFEKNSNAVSPWFLK